MPKKLSIDKRTFSRKGNFTPVTLGKYYLPIRPKGLAFISNSCGISIEIERISARILKSPSGAVASIIMPRLAIMMWLTRTGIKSGIPERKQRGTQSSLKRSCPPAKNTNHLRVVFLCHPGQGRISMFQFR